MPPRSAVHARQDRLFEGLERLEAKDTQHAAVVELQCLIKDMEAAVLPTLLHAAGTQTAKSSPFSRSHCVRLAAQACTPQACTAWRAMLEQPLLGKLLGLLVRALRDAHAAVRSAAVEGLGVVAAQLAAACPESLTGDISNPVLSCILAALGEPGGDAAAACALANVAEHLAPLDPPLLCQLLHAAANPLFLGRAELWGAVACLEGSRVRGLVVSSFNQLIQAWPEVVGHAAEGPGLLGALAAKGSEEFALRAAAARTLQALAVGVGPHAAGWEAVAAALQTAKTDSSKPVRAAAAAALPVVAGLLEFVGSQAPPHHWPAVCGALLAGGSKRPAGGLGAVKPAGATPAAVDAQVGGSLHLIAALHPAPAAAPAYLAYPQQLAAAPSGFPDAMPSYVPAVPPPPTALPGQRAAASQQQLAAELAAIQAQQAHMAAALAALAAANQSTLQQVQHDLACVSAGVAALAGIAAESSPAAAQLQQHLASVHVGVARLTLGANGAQQTPPVGAGQPKRLSSLHRSYDALQADMQPHHQRRQQTAAAPAAGGAPASPAPASPTGQLADSPSPSGHAPAPHEWEAAYSQLLGAPGSSAVGYPQALRLLRCMARSGAVWEQLSLATGQRLMQAITTLLQEGTTLKRLLPHLSPLGDPASPASQAACAYPLSVRQQLLAALQAYTLPAAEQPQEGSGASDGVGAGGVSSSTQQSGLGNKRDVLVSALRALWS